MKMAAGRPSKDRAVALLWFFIICNLVPLIELTEAQRGHRRDRYSTNDGYGSPLYEPSNVVTYGGPSTAYAASPTVTQYNYNSGASDQQYDYNNYVEPVAQPAAQSNVYGVLHSQSETSSNFQNNYNSANNYNSGNIDRYESSNYNNYAQPVSQPPTVSHVYGMLPSDDEISSSNDDREGDSSRVYTSERYSPYGAQPSSVPAEYSFIESQPSQFRDQSESNVPVMNQPISTSDGSVHMYRYVDYNSDGGQEYQSTYLDQLYGRPTTTSTARSADSAFPQPPSPHPSQSSYFSTQRPYASVYSFTQAPIAPTTTTTTTSTTTAHTQRQDSTAADDETPQHSQSAHQEDHSPSQAVPHPSFSPHDYYRTLPPTTTSTSPPTTTTTTNRTTTTTTTSSTTTTTTTTTTVTSPTTTTTASSTTPPSPSESDDGRISLWLSEYSNEYGSESESVNYNGNTGGENEHSELGEEEEEWDELTERFSQPHPQQYSTPPSSLYSSQNTEYEESEAGEWEEGDESEVNSMDEEAMEAEWLWKLEHEQSGGEEEEESRVDGDDDDVESHVEDYGEETSDDAKIPVRNEVSYGGEINMDEWEDDKPLIVGVGGPDLDEDHSLLTTIGASVSDAAQPVEPYRASSLGRPSGIIPVDVMPSNEEVLGAWTEDQSDSNDEEGGVVFEEVEGRRRDPLPFPVFDRKANDEEADDVWLYCYPFGARDITDRCGLAGTNFTAAGVYIPMTTEMGTEHQPNWYQAIREVKDTSPHLKVIGIAYDIPNWPRLVEISERWGVFDGVMLEWIADGSCVDLVDVPTDEQLEKLTKGIDDKRIRYFFRDQDPVLCDTVFHDYINLKGHNFAFEIPDFLLPIFSCMGKNTGECYKAFTHPDYLEAHCDSSLQRYIVNPNADTGGRLLNLLNETCGGTPPHDLYGMV